jgi:hypothetical protein
LKDLDEAFLDYEQQIERSPDQDAAQARIITSFMVLRREACESYEGALETAATAAEPPEQRAQAVRDALEIIWEAFATGKEIEEEGEVLRMGVSLDETSLRLLKGSGLTTFGGIISDLGQRAERLEVIAFALEQWPVADPNSVMLEPEVSFPSPHPHDWLAIDEAGFWRRIRIQASGEMKASAKSLKNMRAQMFARIMDAVPEGKDIQSFIFARPHFNRVRVLLWARAHGFKLQQISKARGPLMVPSYELQRRSPGKFVPGSFQLIRLQPHVLIKAGKVILHTKQLSHLAKLHKRTTLKRRQARIETEIASLDGHLDVVNAIAEIDQPKRPPSRQKPAINSREDPRVHDLHARDDDADVDANALARYLRTLGVDGAGANEDLADETDEDDLCADEEEQV